MLRLNENRYNEMPIECEPSHEEWCRRSQDLKLFEVKVERWEVYGPALKRVQVLAHNIGEALNALDRYDRDHVVSITTSKTEFIDSRETETM